jgi:hypothetical protein
MVDVCRNRVERARSVDYLGIPLVVESDDGLKRLGRVRGFGAGLRAPERAGQEACHASHRPIASCLQCGTDQETAGSNQREQRRAG